MKGVNRICPANISTELREQIITLTKKAYKVFNCSGVVRIDYLVDKSTNTVYLNEINSIPGSMAFYLFESAGIKYIQLLDLIIENALEEYKKKQSVKNSIEKCVFF